MVGLGQDPVAHEVTFIGLVQPIPSCGTNIWIHDCNIWDDDDCIPIKQQDSHSIHSSCSQNMLFERVNALGVGLTIGSVGPPKLIHLFVTLHFVIVLCITPLKEFI
jgi:hypothetical protein